MNEENYVGQNKSMISTETINNHIKKAWGDNPLCPMCNKSDFTVSDTVFGLRESDGADKWKDKEEQFAVVPVLCSNCGNTILLKV